MTKTMLQDVRAELMDEGLLPHEWLLKVMRGEPIEQKTYALTYDHTGQVMSKQLVTELVYPDLFMRADCAKAAAPYFAPRLAAQTVDMSGLLGTHKLSDKELDQRLATLAVQLADGG